MRLLFTIISLTFFLSYGQKKDALLWTGVAADLDLSKKFGVEFESQTRFNSNMSQFHQVYGEGTFNYKIVKGFQAGVVYRYSRKNNGDYYYNDNRFCTDLRYKYKLDFGVSFNTRLRYQHSFDRLKIINNIYPNRSNVMRFALKIRYKNKGFKRVQPEVGAELFHSFDAQKNANLLDSYRLRVGVNLDLPDRHSVKLVYMYEHEFRNVDNLNHIYSIQYSYSIPPFYKKKDKTPKD